MAEPAPLRDTVGCRQVSVALLPALAIGKLVLLEIVNTTTLGQFCASVIVTFWAPPAL